MTDNEIIKAYVSTLKEYEETINRLQAENERLEKGSLKEAMIFNSKTIANVKAEAYKEFFQLIHKEFVDISNGYFESKNIDACVVMQGAIDKLRETYKEMVGKQK